MAKEGHTSAEGSQYETSTVVLRLPRASTNTESGIVGDSTIELDMVLPKQSTICHLTDPGAGVHASLPQNLHAEQSDNRPLALDQTG